MTVTVMSQAVRPLIEDRLPDWVEPRWFANADELLELAPDAQIGWFDLNHHERMAEAVRQADRLEWLNSIYAGLDFLPMDVLAKRKVIVTNGAGINALTIAEYAVMLMLTHAKGYRDVVRAQDRHEWLRDSPGKMELAGSRALLLGYGAIGKLIETRLRAFDVELDIVRRSGGDGALGPDEWRDRLGSYDWILLAVPATEETNHMIGANELARMKDSAVVLNIARGSVIDQPALIEALEGGSIGGALLDVTTPEPLPADHPLWAFDNVQVTMHLSGRAQTRMFQRSADRFIDNLNRWHAGKDVQPRLDPSLGY
jgi:phosphoglycerate dehydrogenase-like enzyme